MTFDKIDHHLWAVRWDGEDDNEIGRIFDLWHDVSFLRGYFVKYQETIVNFFHTTVNTAIKDTIEDAEYLETQILDLVPDQDLNTLFQPLAKKDSETLCLQRNKAKTPRLGRHDSWLRIYAIRLDGGCYLITGGAIKMARKMQDTPETRLELDKIDRCRAYLKSLDITDSDGLKDFMVEN